MLERDAGGSWYEVVILHASDAQVGDYFGYSVSISGDRAIVGAYGEDGPVGEPLPESGAAYVFERDAGASWNEVAILHASDAEKYDWFGCSVAISGDQVIVGAYGEDGPVGELIGVSGAAYVFVVGDTTDTEEGGCGCELPGRRHPRPEPSWILALFGLGLIARRGGRGSVGEHRHNEGSSGGRQRRLSHRCRLSV